MRIRRLSAILAAPLLVLGLASCANYSGDDGDTPDADLDIWAGHIPLTVTALPPVASPDLRTGIPVPAYAKRYSRPGLTD